MVSFVPRGRQVNATRNQTRIRLVSYHRRNQLLILEITQEAGQVVEEYILSESSKNCKKSAN